MKSLVDQRISHFRIVAKIGAGGMGVVYRARDDRLSRDVAIKVLPASFAQDADRVRRFEQEARAAAALGHPNILAVFDVGSHDGSPFIVTELLEGETVRERIKGGGLTVRKSVELAIQIAKGLAAAHDKGIVHRDLKPENVFVTKDGTVKLLDFGLAKLTHPDPDAGAVTPATTVIPETASGLLVGTIGYMAPEQVRAQDVTPAADIFAFGCVLYEMLSGRRAFAGQTPADTISAILSADPPPLGDVQRGVPEGLSRVVARCLEKKPGERFQAARDLAFALRELISSQPTPSPRAGPPSGLQPSVAVLPFANLSADPEQEYFCDGTAEEIINALVHVKGLRVVARTSSFAFKGRSEDVREIGSKLDVAAVLEGSVRKSGDRLRITAQLINVADGYHLWSERFDRSLDDVFAIQDEIAMAVVGNLEVHLLGHERGAMGRRHADNLEAHNAFLKGLFYWNKLSPEGFARSHELFEEAIRRDPRLTSAHAALALWYVSLAYWSDLPPREALAKAVPLAERALVLDPGSAEALTLRGILQGFFARQWREAETSLRRAVHLGPSLAAAHLYLGGLLLVQGRLEEATAETRMALRLDPLSPTTGAWAGSWLAHAGPLEEGAGELAKLIAMNPDHWLLHWAMCHVEARRGRLDVALAEAEEALALSGTPAITLTAVACLSHRVGNTARSDEAYGQLMRRAEDSFVQPTLLAWAQLARGEAAAGIASLERALEIHDPMLAFSRLAQGSFFPDSPEVEAFLDRAILGRAKPGEFVHPW